MRTANPCGNPALHQSSTRMSKAGQQDMGEAALVRTINGVKRIAEGHQLGWIPSRINILGADPRINPFNNDFFNGKCDKVRNPKTLQYDRLPWNVGVLNYEVSGAFLLKSIRRKMQDEG